MSASYGKLPYVVFIKEKRNIMDILLWIVLIIVLSPVIVVAGFIALMLVVCVIGLVLIVPVMIVIKIMDWIF